MSGDVVTRPKHVPSGWLPPAEEVEQPRPKPRRVTMEQLQAELDAPPPPSTYGRGVGAQLRTMGEQLCSALDDYQGAMADCAEYERRIAALQVRVTELEGALQVEEARRRERVGRLRALPMPCPDCGNGDAWRVDGEPDHFPDEPPPPPVAWVSCMGCRLLIETTPFEAPPTIGEFADAAAGTNAELWWLRLLEER